MIIAKKSDKEGNFDPIPAGTYNAVCYAVWDIGEQRKTWQNVESWKHEIIIIWEIDKLIETEGEYKGKRFVISQRYTLSLSEKANLRHHLESWRGKPFTLEDLQGFDVESVIGANCLINIVHNISKINGRTYANISSIMKPIKGTQKMIPENDQNPPEWVMKLQAEAKKEDAQPAPKDEPNQDEFFEGDDPAKMISPEDCPF